MSQTEIRHSVFRPPQGVQALLAKIGWSPDPREANGRAALVIVVIVLLAPFVLSVWRGTAWGSAVDVPLLYDFASLARLAVAAPLLVLA